MEQPAASSALQVDPPPPPAPPHSYDDDSAQEAEEPKRIGAGSFAAIYCIVPGTVVYKVIHRQVLDSVATLKAEFRALDTIYARCSADSIFRLPRSLAFFDPDTEEAIIHTKPGSPGVDLDSLQIFDRATYCMDRVWGISRAARRFIRANFFPDPARRVGPMLCRLYFGRVYEAEQNKGRPRFFTSSNFPLDVARYEALRDRFAGASVPPPPARSVAVGMGQMMAKLHLLGGFDGRDVEFVLAGDGGDGFKLYVIDFNQVRRRLSPWRSSVSQTARCVHGRPTLPT